MNVVESWGFVQRCGTLFEGYRLKMRLYETVVLFRRLLLVWLAYGLETDRALVWTSFGNILILALHLQYRPFSADIFNHSETLCLLALSVLSLLLISTTFPLSFPESIGFGALIFAPVAVLLVMAALFVASNSKSAQRLVRQRYVSANSASSRVLEMFEGVARNMQLDSSSARTEVAAHARSQLDQPLLSSS